MKKKMVPFMSTDQMIQEYGLLNVDSDPLGSYTGVPQEPEEKPVQDADDL